MPTSWLGSRKPSAAAFIELCVAARVTWSRRSAQRASDPLQVWEAERPSVSRRARYAAPAATTRTRATTPASVLLRPVICLLPLGFPGLRSPHPEWMMARRPARSHHGTRTRRKELLMPDTDDIPWATVAAVAGGLVAVAVVVRGVTGVVRIALGEARFRASDPDTWLKWVR